MHNEMGFFSKRYLFCMFFLKGNDFGKGMYYLKGASDGDESVFLTWAPR
jgi:hypothetical protein